MLSLLASALLCADAPKHVVLLAGDEEYRSEEMLPQLAKILTVRHGFRCTVLFSIGKDGTIDPERQDNQPGLEALKAADLVIMMLRFRRWPEEQMRFFDEYLMSGRPILGIRTSTHAFDFESGPYERYGWRSKTWPGGFGKQVLGETWVSHWGDHGKQATRAILEPTNKRHPVLNGVTEIFVPTDVYESHPPEDAQILMWGQVVAGMRPTDLSAPGTKKSSIGLNQPLNDPMMPVVWISRYILGTSQGVDLPPPILRCLTTTMGSAQDFLDESFRRLLVNGAFWLTGLKVPIKADVELVGGYKPSAFGFGGFRKGVRPEQAIG